MLTRKIGKLLRGKATPFQVMAASVLAAWLAFAPGFAQAPGWILALLAVLLVINANLGFALFVFAPLKLVALALLPVSFQIGRVLLDGPTRGLFQGLAGAPALAWFGFEHYATTGGMLLGLVFGVAVGWIVSRAIGGVQRKLASLGEDSERYQAVVAKPWVKLLLFVFVGGLGKQGEVATVRKRVGNPVRIAGLVLVAALVAGAWFLQGLLAKPLMTQALRTELERINGATVNVGAVDLDLGGGRLALTGLAMADPDDLATDRLRAESLEADLDVDDLLRRRFTLEHVALRGAYHGATRAEPGVRTEPSPEPSSPPPATEDTKTLEDYLADAQRWKDRLARARSMLEEVLGERTGEAPAPEADEETLRERLERQVAEQGYARVVSEGLLAEVPTLTIALLEVDGLTSTALPGEAFDVEARNLSTHPGRLAAPPQVDVRSRSDAIALALNVEQGAPEPGALHFHWKGLDVDRLAGSLEVGGKPLLAGGTLDVELDGSWADGRVGILDLPLRTTLHDTSIQVPGHGATPVEHLVLPIGVRGPIDAPRIRVDPDELKDALVAAGASELASRVRAEVESKVDEAVEGAKQKALDELGGQASELLKKKGGLGGLLQGGGG